MAMKQNLGNNNITQGYTKINNQTNTIQINNQINNSGFNSQNNQLNQQNNFAPNLNSNKILNPLNINPNNINTTQNNLDNKSEDSADPSEILAYLKQFEENDDEYLEEISNIQENEELYQRGISLQKNKSHKSDQKIDNQKVIFLSCYQGEKPDLERHYDLPLTTDKV